MANDEFNPIAVARKIEKSYRDYIATTIHFDDADLQAQLERILAETGYLAKGPLLESAPPYKASVCINDLVKEKLLCRSMLTLGGGDPSAFDPNRKLYKHQEQAIRYAAAGRNYAVVTGTGSGKTECFLLPILNDILCEFEQQGPSAGVRAMILYPMNALANDQLKRLRELLKGTDITFGRYTGDTEKTESDAKRKWQEENPTQELMPNEIISRERIRENPPNILLTNYSMLEYLLLRPEDAPLFGAAFGSKWRHIAVDEAHIYSGTLGTEIAFLIRRLKARIAIETGRNPKLHCYATSATIGSDEDMPKVATFAQDLFGEPFNSDPDGLDVITSEKDLPEDALDPEAWGTLPPQTWRALRKLISDHENIDSSAVLQVLRDAKVPDSIVHRMDGKPALLGLGSILLGEASTARLVKRLAKPFDLTDEHNLVSLGPNLAQGEPISAGEGSAILAAMVEVLSAAERTNQVPILTSRYHSFLRAPEGIYINLANRRLTPNKATDTLYDTEGHVTPIYETSVCRHCGQAYILGTEKSNDELKTPYLDPKHEGTDAGDEFIPHKYYRLLPSPKEADADEEVIWLCPVCGSLHNEEQHGNHLFSHEAIDRIPVALDQSERRQSDEYIARCRHCGYSSNTAIQPMRVSPESAGSVVCYDLVREIPPFDTTEADSEDEFDLLNTQEKHAGSIICFSDKRQEAAFFAPSMERTYSKITHRQLIRKATKELYPDNPNGVNIAQIANWIAGHEEYRKAFDGLDDTPADLVRAWLFDELAAEDSRNSLNGLGVIHIDAAAFDNAIDSPKMMKLAQSRISKLSEEHGISWITPSMFKLFLRFFLHNLRQAGCTYVDGGISQLRQNHKKRGEAVVRDQNVKDAVAFVGSSTGAENARSAFIRKFGKTVAGVDVTREEACIVLNEILYILSGLLGRTCKMVVGTNGAEAPTLENNFISPRLWTFRPHNLNDVIYRCDTCGCESYIDTNGVCPTHRCEGHMNSMSFSEACDKDRFYKEIYQDDALPISIEEHTAQLSRKMAANIQSKFIKGEVNVLSCTTTFELGVDVGDLRAVFMRNVPPSTANYTQRAGRVGRRAGKPGYAVTFARLRPHDLAFFDHPETIIAGATRAPSCYLDNSAIAIRHVFAVVFSEFFRHAEEQGKDCSHKYHDFMDITTMEPSGLRDLRDYLYTKPARVIEQLDAVFSKDLAVSCELDIKHWGWVEKLVRDFDDGDSFNAGRLILAHNLKFIDYQRLNEARKAWQGIDDSKAGKCSNAIHRLKDNPTTISVLAESGILPKYGFPTDLVSLTLDDDEASSGDNALALSRGLRQAIREYAPGNEIVASKKLWRSERVNKPYGQELQVRRYGQCSACKTFMWPIENYSDDTAQCICGEEVRLDKTMLIPSYGFRGKRVRDKSIGLRKPRNRGYVSVVFGQQWPNEVQSETLLFAQGSVHTRYASNAQLCALNEPIKGFRVCPYCGAVETADHKANHTRVCKNGTNRPALQHHHALGAIFVSDVLELNIESSTGIPSSAESWQSVMWALVCAAAKLLQIPESELGGTLYPNNSGGMSIMLYDNVPGGAGHAHQLSSSVRELVREAYNVVDGHCGCSDNTCCYGCIANYINQSIQHSLSRGAAKQVLGNLLNIRSDEQEAKCGAGEIDAGEHAIPPCKASSYDKSSSVESHFELHTIDEGAAPDIIPFKESCGRAIGRESSDEWISFVTEMSVLGTGRDLELPYRDVEFADNYNNSAFATLVWKDSGIILLDDESEAEFNDAFGTNWASPKNWRVITPRDTTPAMLIARLQEDPKWHA